MTSDDPDWDWVDDLTQPRPVAVAIVVLLILCVVAATDALAEGVERPKGGVQFDCRMLAGAIDAVAKFRDVDANEEKTIALYHEINPQLRGPQWAVLEREMRRLWRERLPADEASWALFRRCQQQLGDMGREG